MSPFTMSQVSQVSQVSTPDAIKILPGGWKLFAEENGVNKKEPMETFDWMSEDSFMYNDCRDALASVEGAKEWLKTYTATKGKPSFLDEMGMSIPLSRLHSGASASSMLWTYKFLLNNWDTFVYNTKKRCAVEKYRDLIPPRYVYNRLIYLCNEYKESHSSTTFNEIQHLWATYGGTEKTVEEIHAIITPLLEELVIFDEEKRKAQEESNHHSMMGCVEFHYEHPMRWFDTRDGSTLSPSHPSRIPARVMDEMESMYPGYKEHIRKVTIAIQSLRSHPIPYTYCSSPENSLFLKSFMDRYEVYPGKLN